MTVVIRFEVIWDGLSTVTVKPQVLVFPDTSVALHVMDVDPTGKVDPEGGVQLASMAPEQVSVAVALKEAMAPLGPVLSIT